jgi:hypothetical protein
MSDEGLLFVGGIALFTGGSHFVLLHSKHRKRYQLWLSAAEHVPFSYKGRALQIVQFLSALYMVLVGIALIGAALLS